MRARTLLTVVVAAVVLAGCGGRDVTAPHATGEARRSNGTGGPVQEGSGTSESAAQGYLGSGNKNDSTATPPPIGSTGG